jgi:drug/metabolite transporter (DMT)-like permease
MSTTNDHSRALLQAETGSMGEDQPSSVTQASAARSRRLFFRTHLTAFVLVASLVMAALQTSAMKELSDAGAQNCTAIVRDVHGRSRHVRPRHNPHGREGRNYHRPENVLQNPVSVFNILVYGNAVVSIAMIILYGRQKALNAARLLSFRQWFALSLGSLLYSCLNQSFTYLALQETTALNVAVLTRLEPVMIMALARVVLGQHVPTYNVAAAIVSMLGIAVTFLWPVVVDGDSISFGAGELFAVVAAACVACSSIISKTMLNDIPLGLFIIYRCMLGTVLFTVVGAWINGEENLVNPFRLCREVVGWILLYAVLSVLALLLWFSGVKRSSAQVLSLAVSSGFIISLIVGYFVLGEVPSDAEWGGASLIIASLAVAQIGEARERRACAAEHADDALEAGVYGEGERLEMWGVIECHSHRGGSSTDMHARTLESASLSLAERALSVSMRSLGESLNAPVRDTDAPAGAGAIIRY